MHGGHTRGINKKNMHDSLLQEQDHGHGYGHELFGYPHIAHDPRRNSATSLFLFGGTGRGWKSDTYVECETCRESSIMDVSCASIVALLLTLPTIPLSLFSLSDTGFDIRVAIDCAWPSGDRLTGL